MLWRKLAVSLIATVLLRTGSAACQDNNDVLQSRALAALRRSTINGGGMHPYRIEGLITMYDGAGRNPSEGTLEIMRDGSSGKISVNFPAVRATVVSTSKGVYTEADHPLPYYTAKMLRVLQQPVEFSGFSASPIKPPSDAARAQLLDCISIVSTVKAVVRGPEVPKHALCLDRTNDALRLVVDDQEEFIRDDIAEFDQHQVARRLRLQLGGVIVAEIVISQLENQAIDPTQFAPSAGMKLEAAGPVHLSGAMMAGRILKHDSPKYPGSAKAAHIQGVVLVHAIIGKDGHIRDLSLISSPDPLLTEATLKAVRKWTYEPYTLNGVPTEVETTITTSYALGPQ